METDTDVVVAEEWVKLLDRLAAVTKERDDAQEALREWLQAAKFDFANSYQNDFALALTREVLKRIL
jgi:hypothetical protein